MRSIREQVWFPLYLFLIVTCTAAGIAGAADDRLGNPVDQTSAKVDTWGAVVGSFNSVTAYSNGFWVVSNDYNYDTGINTGMKWQCVEYVNRYYYLTYGLNIRVVGHHAMHYFPNAVQHGLIPYSNGGTEAPQVGDVLCSNGDGSYNNFGHVAIVKTVASDHITVIQQNYTNTSADDDMYLGMTFDGSNYTVAQFGSGYPVTGWMRSDLASGDITLASALQILPTRTNSTDIYAIPDEYGVDTPVEGDKNLRAHYTLMNTSGAALDLDNLGIQVLKGGTHQFYLMHDQIVSLTAGESVTFDMRAWITDDRLDGGSPTTFTAKIRYQLVGDWYEIASYGGSTDFTVTPRPTLGNTFLVKYPQPEADPDPDLNKIYYHQWGYKWWINSEDMANALFPGWTSEFYVYPTSELNALDDPVTPNHDSSVPAITDQNFIFKRAGYSTVYILEPEPATSSPLVARPFVDEDAFYSYGYNGYMTPTDLLSQTVELDEGWGDLITEHPIGTSIDVNDPLVVAVSGTISEDTRWTASHKYLVTGNITVSAGVTLTIDPGVVVKFELSSKRLYVLGALDAVGTAGSPIIFTSERDDDIDGHDTNGDGEASVPAPGNWGYIMLSGPDSHMEYCQVRYGGYYSGSYAPVIIRNHTTEFHDCLVEQVYAGSPAAIYCENTAVSLLDNVIQYAPDGIRVVTDPSYPQTVSITGNDITVTAGNGIYFNGNPTYSVAHIQNNSVDCLSGGTALNLIEVTDGSTVVLNTLENADTGVILNDAVPILTGNTIQGMNIPFLFSNDGEADISGNTLSGNTLNIVAHNGTMDVNHTWSALESGTFKHVVTGSMTVSAGAVLTIDPGVVVKFKLSDKRLYVLGTLNAVGTAGSPIVFTSERDDDIDGHDTNGDGEASVAAPGNWGYILLSGPNSHMEYCQVYYGGDYSGGYAPVWIRNHTTEFHDCLVEQVYAGSPAAIYCENAAVSLVDNVIRYAPDGIRVETNPSYPDTVYITDNDIDIATGNGIYFNGNPDYSVAHIQNNTVNCLGGGTALNLIEVADGSTIVVNILEDAETGVILNDAVPVLAGNTIQGMNIPFLFSNDGEADISGNTVLDNTLNIVAHNGTMDLNHTWSILESDTFKHVVTGSMTVSAGAVLTIDPGVVVKFELSDKRMYVPGTLNAVGTAGSPIVFTSERDDDIDGHDSNGDGGGTVAAPGNWGYILLSGPNSHMEYCQVRYGGDYSGGYAPIIIRNHTTEFHDCVVEQVYSGSPSAIFCEATAISLADNVIRNAPDGIRVETNPSYPDTVSITGNDIDIASGNGIYFNGNPTYSVVHIQNNTVDCLGGGTALNLIDAADGCTVAVNILENADTGVILNDAIPVLVGNTIRNMTTPFLFTDDGEADISGNTLENNTLDIVAHNGTMAASHTWSKLEGGAFKHVITGSITVNAGATLTVDPGVVVKFEYSDKRMYVAGTLNAIGTEAAPITFTSDRDDAIDLHDSNGDGGATVAMPGNWGYILLTGPNSNLEHCQIRYGGDFGGSYAPVIIRHRTTVMQNCLVEHVYSGSPAAIYSENTAVSLTDNVIRNAPDGIRLVHNPSYPDTVEISGNDIDIDGGYGIYVNGNPDYSVFSISSNTIQCNDGGTGIYAYDFQAGSLILNNGIYNTVTGISMTNVLAACLQNIVWQGAGSLGTGTGIDIANECDVLLDGNVVSGFSRGVEGIISSGTFPSAIQMIGNQVINSAAEGIYLASTNIGAVDGPDAVINGNDIYGSGTYDLYLGAYQNPDLRYIDVSSNWWGTTDTGAIETAIHHNVDDPGVSPIATVLPILEQAVGALSGSLWVTPGDIQVSLFPGEQVVRDVYLGNRGTEVVNFTLLEGSDAPAKTDISWLDISSAFGFVDPGEVETGNVYINSEGLDDGDYRAHVVVQSDDPVNDLVVVPVQMEVSHVFLSGPAAGDSVSINDTQLLSWSTYNSAGVSSVDLSYSVDGGETFDLTIAEGLPNVSPYL